MKQPKSSNGITRRKFLKGVGSGVVGSTVLLQTLPSLPDPDAARNQQPNNGMVVLEFTINGKAVHLLVEPRMTLAEVIRNQLHLTGTKVVCNQGECGGCTVLLDGKAVYSCHMLALDAAGKTVTTIEGLMNGEKLHPLQEAFIEHDGFQCGFCTPGQIMAAHALLQKHPHPTREQVKEGMAGNLCRCAAYPNIIESVLAAAEK
ncbi:MAG: (2Fe-2S)-binding protein [candidate division KSB1 bacterium]|nr:(2Fe-2S)-binding protein [candidate division KSB1 bacterium]MDZ7317553.1 (2Fe-2S)-binding protein [candidate division KSB1 bacterium]MDZ7342040.1 (2Fe-2S)-binding protein [candidate division KSB1 bacterium]